MIKLKKKSWIDPILFRKTSFLYHIKLVMVFCIYPSILWCSFWCESSGGKYQTRDCILLNKIKKYFYIPFFGPFYLKNIVCCAKKCFGKNYIIHYWMIFFIFLCSSFFPNALLFDRWTRARSRTPERTLVRASAF